MRLPAKADLPPGGVWSELGDAGALRDRGLFVAEGRRVIHQILEGAAGGPEAIVAALATPAAAEALQLASRLTGRVEVRSPAAMQALTGFNFHRGALAIVRRPPVVSIAAVIARGLFSDRSASGPYQSTSDGRPAAGDEPSASAERTVAGRDPSTSRGRTAAGQNPSTSDGRTASRLDSLACGRDSPGRTRPLLVVGEQIADADNVGSLFRNARAFGAAAVLLDDTSADPLYRKAVRTSLGAVLTVPWGRAPLADILAALAGHEALTVGLTPDPAAPTLGEALGAAAAGAPGEPGAALASPIALLVGNEGTGLTAAALAACRRLARIPMAPGADSLNVATALAVALYETTRRGWS